MCCTSHRTAPGWREKSQWEKSEGLRFSFAGQTDKLHFSRQLTSIKTGNNVLSCRWRIRFFRKSRTGGNLPSKDKLFLEISLFRTWFLKTLFQRREGARTTMGALIRVVIITDFYIKAQNTHFKKRLTTVATCDWAYLHGVEKISSVIRFKTSWLIKGSKLKTKIFGRFN